MISGGGSASSNSNESAAEDETEESIARPSMVEPPLFDIYLCDYCDAELYSLEACREHEKSCQETSEQGLEEDDSDVILCDEPSSSTGTTIASAVKRRSRKKAAPERDVKAKKRKPAYEEVELLEESDEDQGEEGEEDSNDGLTTTSTSTSSIDNQMRSFLSHFQLVSAKGSPADNWPKQRSPRKSGGRSPVKVAKGKSGAARRGRNDRSVLTLQRCATVPLTSPMGKFLLRTQKTMLADDYKQERSDRVERFCIAPVIRDGVKPRWLTVATSGPTETFPVTYRKIDYRNMFEKDEGYDRNYVHQYRFPRRQLSTRWRELSWIALTQVLLTSCRPFSVDLQRMTETDIRVCYLHLAIERKKRELMELRKADLVRMYEQQQRMLKRPPDECIDLCSSSDDEDEAEETGTGAGRRRPGPKGKQDKERAKRQRFGDAEDHDDEMKENRAIQFVQTTLGAQRNGFLAIQMRNHSALQLSPGGGGDGDGDLGKPLSVSVGVTGSWASAAAATAQGSPQTAAQLGVLLPNDNGVLGAVVNSHKSGGGGSISNAVGAASHTGPPSSYLFLTKQQLVYQQLEVSSTESEVVPGHEVEEVVACEVNVVTTSASSNSPLSGRRGGEEVTTASNSTLETIPTAVDEESTPPSSILAQQLLKGKDTTMAAEVTSPVVAQPKDRKRTTSSSKTINEISSTAKEAVRTSLPARVAGDSGGGIGASASTSSSSLSSQSSSSSSLSSQSSSSSRLRRTSVVDSYPLPKKMPSLIRIAPA